MPKDEDLLRFPDITQQIESTYHGNTAFLCENLDAAVAQCARHAFRNGVKTKVTLELIWERGKGDEVIIRARLETKLPNPKPLPISAFVDREGNLVKDDPRQAVMPFGEFPKGGNK